jgi:hypothetical protein
VTALHAWMDEPIDWEAFEQVTLSLLDDRGGERCEPKDTRPRTQTEAPAQANQGQEAEAIALWERDRGSSLQQRSGGGGRGRGRQRPQGGETHFYSPLFANPR